MISIEELKNGQEYWYSYLLIGIEGGLVRFIKPTKVIFKLDKGSDTKGKFYYTDKKRTEILTSLDIELDRSVSYILQNIYKTESECKSDWNEKVLYKLNFVEADIDNLVRKYKNKLAILEKRKDKLRNIILEFKAD